MPDFSFVVVAVIAFLAPVLRELIPKLFVPAIVLELVLGIVVGPQVLDIAHSSEPVELFSTIGLAALLFLAGREIDVGRLRGEVLERGLACFGLGFLIAAAIAAPLHEIGLIKTPLLVAVILVATSLSVIIVPLRDEGEINTSFGQQVIATAAIAEFASVILLSFFYSNERPGFGTELVHLCAFALLAVVVFLTISRGARNDRLSEALDRLRETSAQIQTRADLALIAVVVGITSQLGLETILAAFTVGVIRGMTEERSERMEQKREAVALGIFVPFFFVSSGLDFQLDELFATIGGVIRLPVFVLALLAVHVIPALIYARTMGTRKAIAAGLLQATSFSFVIVATQIGLQLHVMVQATATALVGAGLISVVAFPAIAFALLRGEDGAQRAPPRGEPSAA
ncbi:MAG TPA: cation:proton antiporter [Solirubrobacterales bacterium]|nr:cation:proton antiporter [Solirubrobacterales bacterium]